MGCLVRSRVAKSDFFGKSVPNLSLSLLPSLFLQSKREYEPASYFVIGLADNYG